MENATRDSCVPRGRHGGVELFRLCMMLLVVLCHICCQPRPDGAVLIPLAISLIGVPGFVSISGWFGIRFSWRKWFSLWGCMAFYGVVSYFCPYGPVDAKLLVSGGWFLAPYLVLLMFAPVINAGVAACCSKKNGLRNLLIMMVFLLAVTWISSWPFGWAKRFIGMYAADFGRKSLFAMLATYVIAHAIAKSETVRRLSIKRLFGILALAGLCFFAQLAVFRLVLIDGPVQNVWKILPYCGYNSIFVVAFSLGLLLLSQRLEISARWTRVLVFVNASLLPVYLIHNCTSAGRHFLCRWLYGNILQLTGNSQGLAIGLSVFACFAACVALDMLCRRAPLGLLRWCAARIRGFSRRRAGGQS